MEQHYWVPHKELVFIPCRLERKCDQDAVFVTENSEEVTHPAKSLGDLLRVHESQRLGVDNVCTLEEVCHPALLHTVRVRYSRQQIYTHVARILIAVNPFKALPIYSMQYLEKYRQAITAEGLAPHIYSIGSDAVIAMRNRGDASQAVLISGESGAGKTESTKQVLMFAAEVLGAKSGGLQDNIMRTNPVLEAFGNAMTVRNNNSSRFGKWLQLTVPESLTIEGCTVTDYLLELTRVCSPGEQERNYHIFFQLIEARGRDELKHLNIAAPGEYVYLQGCKHKAPGIDDMSCFDELKDAFVSLGFSSTLQDEVFRLVVGILALGNVDFTEVDEDKAAVSDDSVLDRVAGLIGIESDVLRQPLLERKITVGKDVTIVERTASQAKSVRDGLARLLYGRLFKWLIAKINEQLSGKTSTGRFLGLLDIAGFESFEKNSLEQLFINLSNEQLQQHFNTYVFKLELEDYEAEGINTGNDIGYVDNTDIITLLEAKNGILSLLDEEAALAKATDLTFVSKVFKAHEKHRRLVVPKFTGGLKFGVKHFAGEVTYTCDGFLDKNVDKPPDEAPTLLQASSLQVLQELGAKIAADLAESAGGGRQKKTKTVSSTFRTSLASLMAKLKEAEPHFIRCVKPNVEKVPDKFTSKLVNEQLLNSGVFEAVKIRQSGFASRIPFKDFWERFWVCIPKKKRARESMLNMAVEEQVKLLVEMMPVVLLSVGGVHKGELVLGRTKVFAKTRVINALEKSRELSVTGHACDIMRIWRGNRVRKMMKSCFTVYADLKHWISENDFYTSSGHETAISKYQTAENIKAEVEKLNGILERLARLAALPKGEAMRTEAEKVRQKMLNEVEAIEALHSLQGSLDPVEIEKAIARVKALDIPTVSEVELLMARVQKLTVQAPLIQALENAINSEDLQQDTEVWEVIRKEGFKDHPEYWLYPRGSELVNQMWNSMEKLKAKKKQEEAEEKERQKRDAEKAGITKAKMEATFEEKEGPAKSPSPTPQGRQKSQRKRSTITGFSEQQQQRVLISLMEACRVYDMVAIEKNLQEATQQGIPGCEAIENAHELLRSMQTESFLMEAIQRKQTSLGGDEVPVDELKSMRNLLHHASTLNFAVDCLKDARGHLQQGVRRRARMTIHGKLFEEVDLEEFHLAEGTFCLSYFKSLKPVDQWRRGRSLREKFAKRNEQETDEQILDAMVSYQRDPINVALTCVPPTRDPLCTRTFKSILSWMGDKPVPEMQLFGYVQEICETANADRFMADETYVQLMKQLTRNPSKRSTMQGYKLMLRLCQTVCPSKDLDDFLRSFLMTSLRQECDDIVMICKQCIADLNINLSLDPGEDEGTDVIPISVLLIDNSTRKLHVSAKARFSEIGERLCEQLRIPTPKEFAFFQVTDGIDMHRLMPDVVRIDTVLAKWAKLKEATKRTSRLLFKRRLLRHDERLQAINLSHATLTYQQAIWDFLHYPILEDTEFICEIAAAILFAEKDSFNEQIEKKRLGDAGILERLVPDSALNMNKWGRSKLATQVLQAYQKLESTLDPRENRHVKMSHCLSLMQRLRLFGTYHWLGTQTLTPEEEKASVPVPPEHICRINPKEPEGEYWICVDTFGIRFVSPDCTSGKKSSYQRGFLFNDEALEKVICCGAKQNLVQFVVTAYDNSQSSQGRMTMLISLTCPAAVDVAFLVHTLHESRLTMT